MEKRRRTLNVERFLGKWTINGQTWDDVIASDFQMLLADPALGDVEMWTVANRSGGWFHPVHIHLVDFRIISRNGRPPHPWELGPKDVVYAGENESVQLLMRFEHQRGRYMVHCHNLTHEDHDMMGQFGVGWKPGQPDPNDPIRAARCRFDDLPD
jgi:FtsP/CotA-like multicopper oxidase with cupredoxin domain